jgi:excisionase family DNA binding protein
MARSKPKRFLTIPEVAEELATSTAQITALVRRGELPALKLTGHGQWRIERAKLEEFIAKSYERTQRQRGSLSDDEPTDDELQW